jgi:DNA-binding NarL/FixJ family response regulator
MSTDLSIKVFIVDDHHLIIEGLKTIFENQDDIDLVGSAVSGDACLNFFKTDTADVVLMDINLPDTDGINLCEEILKQCPSTKIIGLSTSHQRSYVSKMMANGARGYLLKNSNISEIREAIRQVNKGNIFFSKDAGEALYKIPASEEGTQMLTLREKEILNLVSQGLSTPKIANKLFISELTVDTHRRNLMAKLKVKNAAALIKLAIEKELICL